MLVNNDITSNETTTSAAPIVLPENALYSSKLLLTLLLARGIELIKILCKKEAMEYNAVLIDETMILNGKSTLCIFGRAYLGRRLFL